VTRNRWWRPRTRTVRLVEDLQTRFADALEQLGDLERRIAVLEQTVETTLLEVAAGHERHRQHLTHLKQSVERQKYAVGMVEQMLDEQEREDS
jgi:uncharacterized protein involved in exopolysaccharide biosynthesis